jgi:hypothetical protein
MARKRSKTVQGVKKAIVPILNWWNLKNWSSSVDLFLKLMGIVALILAADFFLLKPEIVWEVKYLDQIDRSKVEEYYRKEGMTVPDAVTDAINNFLSSIDYRKQTGIIDTSSFLTPSSESYEPGVPDGQFVFYLFDFLSKYNLSDDEEWLAWLAISNATTTTGKITISNIGDAPATRIQVIPPPPFVLDQTSMQSFDLAPNNSIMVIINSKEKYDFSSEYFYGNNPGGPPNIVVVWDTPNGVINKTLFLWLSIFAITIWITVMIKEIWFSKEA